MADFLGESRLRANRPRMLQAVMRGTTAKYEADIKTMRDLADQIVAALKSQPIAKKDLLDIMLNSRDSKTGQFITEQSIAENLLTFLIAGHATSSGMMTFMVYFLKNPETMGKLRAQIDEVLGDRPVQYQDFAKLPYLIAVMRETLRLAATAPMCSTQPLEDTEIGGGKYSIRIGGWVPTGALVMASVIQKFDPSLVNPSYTLQIKQTLAVKPKGLYIHAAPRTGAGKLLATPSSALIANRDASALKDSQADSAAAGVPFYVLYGSNTGTSEAFAQRIGKRGAVVWYSALGKIPNNRTVVMITASDEGEPADNAARFVDWLRYLRGNVFQNVRFAVFGCGNSDWTATFQRIPALCDELSRSTVEADWFHADPATLGQVISSRSSTSLRQRWIINAGSVRNIQRRGRRNVTDAASVDAGKEWVTALRQADALLGRVVEKLVLTKGGPVKRDIEFELPAGVTARPGDYVAILPQNSVRDVHRVLARFGLSNEEETDLPVGKPVKLSEILTGYIELSQPATTKDFGVLFQAASSDATRAYIEGLKASYNDSVQATRLSVFEILESHPDIQLLLRSFLQMLPSMRIHQYLIPLWNPSHITITISVINAPALSGTSSSPFLGVGSNSLASLIPGDRVQMVVRPSAASFHLSETPTTLVVMFCSGSGLAPMRGFIQERAAQKASGREQLAEWIKQSVVDVRPAFSRSPADSDGCTYHESSAVFGKTADVVRAYAKVAKGIKTTLLDIIMEQEKVDVAEATKKFEKITKARYATDIFD
ncbi:fatty acid hydroxylase [Mycena sanguinolenta]|nr:fatty acid hydroxylase [Mycena sanguinolenta]